MSHSVELPPSLTDNDRDLIRARTRYERARHLAVFLVAALLSAVLGLIVVLLVSVQNTQAALESCTVPGRACYKDSQRRSAVLIGELIDAQNTAVANGSKPSRENLTLTKANSERITIALAILEQQYPEAAKAARAQIEKGK